MKALQVLRFMKEEQALQAIGRDPLADGISDLRPDHLASGEVVPFKGGGWEIRR